MSKTIIHFEMNNDVMLIEHLKGECIDLMALLATITAKLESQVPEESREIYRTDLLKAMNIARKGLIND